MVQDLPPLEHLRVLRAAHLDDLGAVLSRGANLSWLETTVDTSVAASLSVHNIMTAAPNLRVHCLHDHDSPNVQHSLQDTLIFKDMQMHQLQYLQLGLTTVTRLPDAMCALPGPCRVQTLTNIANVAGQLVALEETGAVWLPRAAGVARSSSRTYELCGS